MDRGSFSIGVEEEEEEDDEAAIFFSSSFFFLSLFLFDSAHGSWDKKNANNDEIKKGENDIFSSRD